VCSCNVALVYLVDGCLCCGKSVLCFSGGRAAGGNDVLQDALVSGVVGGVSAGLDIGCDAGALPVAAGSRVDRFGDGDGRFQVGMYGESLACVGASAGALADDARPAELLEVVAQLLGAGERGGAGQRVDRLRLPEAAVRDMRECPLLVAPYVLTWAKTA
jgi:hypothetical protein